MPGDVKLNGDSQLLWDMLKRELDANKENINRVENRLLDKFDALDKRFDERDKREDLESKRLDSTQTKVEAHDKLIWILVSAVAIASAGVLFTALLHL